MTLPEPIASRSNARVKALRAAFSGEARSPGDLAAVEGTKMLGEAARSGILFETIFLRESSQAIAADVSIAALRAREWVVLQDDAFASAVDTVSPQGIAGTFSIPESTLRDHAEPALFLALENVQDPGNLGTLLRSAEAFGVQRVYALGSTANAWNPKTVRASAGSVFRVVVVRRALDEFAAEMRKGKVQIFATVVADAAARNVTEIDLRGACALLIGNEGAGLSAASLALADQRISIPCATESLNAAIAGSLVLYEAMRQRGAHSVTVEAAKGLA